MSSNANWRLDKYQLRRKSAKRCITCEGAGQLRQPITGLTRPCPTCHGSGKA